MKTFGDLFKLISSARRDMELFGCTQEFENGFRKRCQAVGSALCQERNKTPYAVSKLPLETILGDESGPLAKNLENWFSLETAIKR